MSSRSETTRPSRRLDPRLVRYARSVRALLAADVGLGVGSALLVIAQATLLAHVVAAAFAGASLAAEAPWLGGLAGAVLARAAVVSGFELAGRLAAQDVTSRLRLDLVERRLRHDPASLDSGESGELAATAVQGVDLLEPYFARYLPQLVLSALVPIAVLAWTASIDLVSAGLMLATLPLVPVFMVLVGRQAERRARERWRALSLLEARFLDVVRGLPTLRAFNRGEAQVESIAETSERYREQTMGTLRVSFLSGSVLELAATLGVALVAVTVGVRLTDGGIGFRAALTVLLLAPELYAPLRALGAQFHASADGLAAAERLLDLLEAAPNAGRARRLDPPDPRQATIRLEDVSFAYPARRGRVLNRLDLELRPGETVALLGPSGAGKTTVALLLLGLLEPTRGRVTVGGVDLASCRLERWQARVAWVPQRPALLAASVAENIRLADPTATDERVEWAAARAGADELVRRLPAGYETRVGDGGRGLSAGERQRIALARAFLRDPSLVVLDEPTANLDPASAARVGRAIERLAEGRTMLLVCHRPELARLADRIVELGHAPWAVAA